LAKTMLNVISVFDGTEDATDVFVSLIARKISETKQQDKLAKPETMWYDVSEVPVAETLASGL